MEGVTLIKDITHNKQLVQIEIDNLEQLEENREDILDVIIASLRKVSWNLAVCPISLRPPSGTSPRGSGADSIALMG